MRAGVDGRALDANLAHHQHGLGRARRRLDAGHGDGGAARLRQRNRRPLEALALAAGLVAGRDDLGAGRNALCDGSERYADHRQSRRDGAHAGEHARTPRTTDFALNLTSRRKPDAIAGGRPVLAIFPDVSIRSHRCWGPCGIGLPAVCGKPERRQNPPDRDGSGWPIGRHSGRGTADSGEHRRPSRVAVSGFRGGDPVWWGSQTSTGATPESAWKWRAPSATRVPAQACCRWRRSGFAWPTGCRPTLKTNPIRSKVEVPLARSRPRVLTTPAPSRAGCDGGARSRPVRPGAGIPPQSCDIVWTGPFVATTRPSAHAFRMHASHAARNLQHGRGMCRVHAWDGVSQAANSVCSPPHETRACPGFAYGCASRAGRTCGGEGVGVGVAVILLGSSSSMPSTLESSTPRLLASLRLAYLQLLSCGHLFVSLLRPPPLAPPQPAAGLPASGKHKSDQPRQAGVGLGEGNAPIMRQLS